MSNPRSNVSGSVLVEFSGALILLLMMVFGITEIGRAIYQLNTLTKSVEAGARYMSRAVSAVSFDPYAATPQQQCQIDGTYWDAAAAHATNIVLYGTEATGLVMRLPQMQVVSIEVTPHLDSDLSRGGACVVKVSARAPFLSLLGGNRLVPSFYGSDDDVDGLVLTADAEERYIGE